MRWPGVVSLWGVLCLGVSPGGGRPPRLEKVRADTRSLSRTLSARIQQLQMSPPRVRVGGAEAAEGAPPAGLGALSQRLLQLQLLLAALASGGDPPLAQIANDTENLRALLAAWGGHLGCPSRKPTAPPAWPPGALGVPPEVSEAPHTAAGVALARLRRCLDDIAAGLDGTPAC